MSIRLWAEWVGSLDGRATMFVTALASWRGWKLDLHKFVAADDAGCFHTHPAWAFRLILWGGYVEEHFDGRRVRWRWLDFGVVRPSTCHRVARLLGPRAYTLWIRGPKVAKIQLRGAGWPRDLRPIMGAELSPADQRDG